MSNEARPATAEEARQMEAARRPNCWCDKLRSGGGPPNATCEPCKNRQIASLTAQVEQQQKALKGKSDECELIRQALGSQMELATQRFKKIAGQQARIAVLEGALKGMVEAACRFNCDAESSCNCEPHARYRRALAAEGSQP